MCFQYSRKYIYINPEYKMKCVSSTNADYLILILDVNELVFNVYKDDNTM